MFTSHVSDAAQAVNMLNKANTDTLWVIWRMIWESLVSEQMAADRETQLWGHDTITFFNLNTFVSALTALPMLDCHKGHMQQGKKAQMRH